MAAKLTDEVSLVPRPARRRRPHTTAALAATYPLRCFAPQWARFDNRHSTSVPAPTLAVVSGSGARGTSSPLNRQCYPPHFMRECIPPNLHDPQRAKGPLDRRSKRLSFPHFFLRRKKCGRRRPPPRQGKANSPPQRRKRALFVSDGDNFAPRRERFFCLRRPHFFQQRKKWGKERRQKLRFCTSSARYACSPLSVFPHVTGIFLIVVVPPTVPAQLSAAAACYYGKNYSFCRVAG